MIRVVGRLQLSASDLIALVSTELTTKLEELQQSLSLHIALVRDSLLTGMTPDLAMVKTNSGGYQLKTNTGPLVSNRIRRWYIKIL